VFQRRFDGSVDFFRNWNSYVYGFGDARGEYWFGLEKIHKMTSLAKYALRIDMQDNGGVWKYAIYTEFKLSNASTGFMLQYDAYSGDAELWLFSY
ncbi:hypothetical protein KUTeg_007306, partial [Tegillarca granosa]